jgi:hypothetical protein
MRAIERLSLLAWMRACALLAKPFFWLFEAWVQQLLILGIDGQTAQSKARPALAIGTWLVLLGFNPWNAWCARNPLPQEIDI